MRLPASILCGCLIVLVGCGGGGGGAPTGPGIPAVSGSWSGTFTWLVDTCDPLHEPTQITLVLTQTGATIHGQLGTALDYEGTIVAGGAFELETGPFGAFGATSTITGLIQGDALTATERTRSVREGTECLLERRLDLARTG